MAPPPCDPLRPSHDPLAQNLGGSRPQPPGLTPMMIPSHLMEQERKKLAPVVCTVQSQEMTVICIVQSSEMTVERMDQVPENPNLRKSTSIHVLYYRSTLSPVLYSSLCLLCILLRTSSS